MRTLAIDWGSTAIRQSIYFMDEHRSEMISNLEAGYINISGNGPVYTGDDVPAALQIPAKLVLGNGRGIEESNALLTEINRRRGNVNFDRRCQEGLEKIVKAFSSQVQKRCEKRNDPLEIVEIGLTIPAHWTLEEEESYSELIGKVFPRKSWNNRLKYIYFMTEIEAFAHFFFDDADVVDRYMGDEQNNYVMFLDFGGHSMNGCLFYVRRAEEKFVFMRVEAPFGVVGGSAQWEAAVGDFCTNNALSGWGSRIVVNPEVRNGFQKRFREEIRMHECNRFEEIELRIKPPRGYAAGAGDMWTTISAQQSAQFFREAMDKPLRRAETEIKELAAFMGRYADVGVKVVVSGGTAKNETVQGKLKGFCQDVDLPPPIFVHQNFGSNESFNIAKGAALATARRMTLMEFMENGAAFGIQMLRGSGNPDRQWDENAFVVLADKGRSWKSGRPYEVKLSGADRLKIICDPFWTSGPRGKKLSCSRTYDVLDLLVPEKGTWKLSLSMGPDERSLVLQQSMVPESGLGVRPPRSTVLKMEFRRSEGCFLVEVNEAIESLHDGLGLNEDGTFVALTNELEQALRRTIEQRLATSIKDTVGLRQNKRRFGDMTGNSARRRSIGKTKPQYTRLQPIKGPPARRRPERPQRDLEEEEEEEEIEFLNPASDSESYHSVPTTRESSISLGAFTQLLGGKGRLRQQF
ncbi:uncharacterized protein LY79DRAFT_630885 [Colletotrichum navitas]|uniref:Uncharacterized protein n=1 Tax=Colletotrichum navitas TaxID=681940 RepID=A0AAD8Q1P4_9PEZI|nr:uncharacterized protein LY79DRAFT_630885 [Colletotrichum navitas]KAK1593711.1 hypothetical protein LY79DRAFT_630885 [Colletotrichum navitas]